MSTYSRETKNPDTGEWEIATWIDDYFGSHNYGVRFPSMETKVFRADERKWEFR